MSEISLAVTKGILEYAQGQNAHARQVAYSNSSEDIAARLATITGTNRVTLRIGGLITLVVADSSSTWRAHNKDAAKDFDILFEFLAHYPSRKMRFVCEVVT
jgi:hypothetical protein